MIEEIFARGNRLGQTLPIERNVKSHGVVQVLSKKSVLVTVIESSQFAATRTPT